MVEEISTREHPYPAIERSAPDTSIPRRGYTYRL
jgi:hypothetical protein